MSIYEAIQIEALSDLLNSTESYFHRKVCRWYSETFHTPLHVVLEGNKIMWDEVLRHFFEVQFEKIGFNQAYDLACEEYIPELIEEFEKRNEEFAKALEKEQKTTMEKHQQKLKKKITKTQEKINELEIKNEKLPPKMNLNFEDEY